MSRVWVLFYADAPNPSGMPDTRPAELSRAERRAPWVGMSMDDYDQVLIDTQPEYDAWRAANPIPTIPSATIAIATDGSRWELDPSGTWQPT